MNRRHAGRGEERRNDRAIDIVQHIQRRSQLAARGRERGQEVSTFQLRVQNDEEVQWADDFHDEPAQTAGEVEGRLAEGGFAGGMVGEEPLGYGDLSRG